MIINKYCKCGMYIGEVDTKTDNVVFDKDTVYIDDDRIYKCKVCGKVV